MAQHILIDENYVGETDAETIAVQKIVHGVHYDLSRSYSGFNSSFKWQLLPKDYCFDGSDGAFRRRMGVRVPASMVWGGRADVEVHMKDGKLYRIYLVA